MEQAVLAGDVQGKGIIYSPVGTLVMHSSESVLSVAEAWDMHVWSPWTGIHPTVIFLGFNPRATSKLYVTSERIVLIRDIDAWRELAGEMTPLGIPTAIGKETKLKQLKASGVRQFCQVRPQLLKLAAAKKSARKGSRLALRLEDLNGVRYAVNYWKTDGSDEKTLSLLESRFGA